LSKLRLNSLLESRQSYLDTLINMVVAAGLHVELRVLEAA